MTCTPVNSCSWSVAAAAEERFFRRLAGTAPGLAFPAAAAAARYFCCDSWCCLC